MSAVAALQIIAAIDGLLGLALRMQDVAKQLSGEAPIPTIDELLAKQKLIKENIEQAKTE